MEQCPQCKSFNTRQSRRQSEHGLRSSLFSAWFRCRECGCRFQSTDHFMIQKWTMGAILLCLFAGVLVWAFLAQNGADYPARLDHAYWSEPTSNVDRNEGFPRSVDPPDPAILQAAENNDAEAQYRVGLAIVQQYWTRSGQSSLGDATKWIRKAAEQNHVRAQLVLGALYERGSGVIQNYAEASHWYRRASLQGDPLAMSRLGRMMQAGRGSPN